MTHRDPNIDARYHEPVPKAEVVGTDPKTGKVTLVRHVCRDCGRLISQGRHV
jgi:ribosomal protein L32